MFIFTGEDSKMLVCDVCDKGFHTFCLTPVITRVPPNGWRCHVSILLCSMSSAILQAK